MDVDKLNTHDPQACAAYAELIFQYLREAEVSFRLHEMSSRCCGAARPD